ncbi:DUF5060 domain-containing protein [Persicitalea jodogahamensis]|uniref:DUF5060 domain-containing protein n=1 Tax=Persicitalea jodogahamensis TaxID=402147 RepID=A0A8J3GBG0_9BACT|nr:DUF5060 domain-containing protein [Persicitalea jodogahamensis]GHB86790.1 hypothetical protein GCM10007390_48130 [Persicitalea jodogahamensis]
MKIASPLFTFALSLSLLFSCKTLEEDRPAEYPKWQTVTLDFRGTATSETAADNPFLNYRLLVDFKHEDTNYVVRGFYAADGDAANTSADSGNVWRVHFTPDREGAWEYSARMERGDRIAFADSAEAGEAVAIEMATGTFRVVAADSSGSDFMTRGRLVASNGYFRFGKSGKYWLKSGANSPENLLAYADFDDTYRMVGVNKEKDTPAPTAIHVYAPHLGDWKSGDPTWKGGKGKGLIGGINYLASKGMNAMYFLTMNIGGDGKDVWPFRSPVDFTRFDVSKLAQWEVVFQHMQSRGVFMQIVLQETENETLLDSGSLGPMRQLYLREMVARFGHHPALNWNLGEENGPVHFSPVGQNDAQRKAMASFIKKIDPYRHPVTVHTLPTESVRKVILDSLLGFADLDGVALQVAERTEAVQTVLTWKDRSRRAGHPWLVTMDEIGKWDVGARSDAEDPDHETLRGDVLWGTLLSGASGIEWYFGAFTQGNDLTLEDWRSRERLWDLTRYALDFFRNQLPYWEMRPNHGLAVADGAFCLRKPGETYALYFPKAKTRRVDLRESGGEFNVRWYDPLSGGALQSGSVATVQGGSLVDLGLPPGKNNEQDWVVLLEVTN